jgi:hypothetical protein
VFGLAVALSLIFAATWLVSHDSVHGLLGALSVVGTGVFLSCGGIWASRAAGGSVLDEIRGRTWDFQRLSALTPWAMTWGKLLGAASLAWIAAGAGLVCAGLGAAALENTRDALILVVGLIGLAVFLQGCAMGAALVGVRKARAEGRVATGGAVLLGVAGGLLLLSALSNHLPIHGQSWTGGGLNLFNGGPVTFWGQRVYGPAFAAVSLCAFAAWAVVGAWRLMRLELQVHNSPWIWVAFLVFAGLWRAGLALPETGPAGPFLTACAVFAALTYASAFVEPADPVRLRRFVKVLSEGRLLGAADLAPALMFPLKLALLSGIAAAVIPRTGIGELPGPTTIVAILVFLIRDIGVIALFRYGPRPGRGDLSAVVALFLLYGVGGIIDRTVGQGYGLALFTPLTSFAPLSVMISGVVQAAVAWVIAGQRLFHTQEPTLV